MIGIHPVLLHCPGFPGDTSGKEPTGQCRRHTSCGFHRWVRKIPWRERLLTPLFWSGEFIAYGVAKSQTRLRDFHFQFFKVVITFTGGSVVKNMPANPGVTGLIPGLGRSLEEEMSVHSRILARIIPWREEPGNLQSMES